MSAPELTSPRLLLNSLRPDDAAELFRYRSSPQVRAFQGWDPRSTVDADHFIERVLSTPYDTPETWYQFAIRDSRSRLVGDLGVHFGPAGSGDVEIGVTVAPEEQRRGIAREALTRLFDHLFDDLEKRRVLAVAVPENRAVLELLRRLGMSERPGSNRDPWYREHTIDGVWMSLGRAVWGKH